MSMESFTGRSDPASLAVQSILILMQQTDGLSLTAVLVKILPTEPQKPASHALFIVLASNKSGRAPVVAKEASAGRGGVAAWVRLRGRLLEKHWRMELRGHFQVPFEPKTVRLKASGRIGFKRPVDSRRIL